MKRILIIALCLVLICTPLGAVSTYVDESIKVLVNGSPVATDIVMHNNSVFVPLRFMSNQLNAQVSWDSKTRTVAVKKGGSFAKPTPGQILITGSDSFKSTINECLSLLKSKAPEKYTMIISSLSTIKEGTIGTAAARTYPSTGVCIVDLNSLDSYAKRVKFTNTDTKMFLTGALVHEAYHANCYKRGIQNVDGGITTLESEVLAQTQLRQTLKLIGASSKVYSVTSIDYIVDTNYQGIN